MSQQRVHPPKVALTPCQSEEAAEPMSEAELARLRGIVQTAAEGVWTIDAEARTSFVNPRMAQILGYRAEEMIGRPIEDFMEVSGRCSWTSEVMLRKEGSAGPSECTFRRKNGSEAWVSFSINPITDAQGAYQGALAMVTDISARKKAEAALEESEEKFRTLFENSGDAIILLEFDRVLDCNARTLEIFGAESRDQLVGRTPDDFSPPCQPNGRETHEFAREKIAAALDGRPQFFEWTQKKMDGTPFPAEVTLNMVKLRDKVLLQAIVRDITERRQGEEALSRTTELLERTGELAKVGGWELDLRTMKVYWTLETCHIHEVDPPVAPPLEQAIHFYAPEAQPLIRAAVEEGIAHGTPWDLELPLITAKGRNIWVHAQGAPVLENGLPIKLTGAFHEITERKLAQAALAASEAALQRANEELQRSNEALERRVAERTAQLRALTTELTNAEERVRLQTADSLHESLSQLLSAGLMNLSTLQAHVTGDTAAQRIEDLKFCLDESINVCRNLTYELSPPVLQTLGLGAALQWLGMWHHNKYGLIVSVDAARGVFVEEEELRITLFRAASELLFNVFKHAQVREARVRLSRVARGAVRLEVSDPGVGFDPAAVRAREGSTGSFGLFSLRERIEALGGKFDVRSAPGQGSRITMTLPVSEGSGSQGATGDALEARPRQKRVRNAQGASK